MILMKPNKDAFGQEMLAHFKGKDSFEIIERDDKFFDVSSGPKTYFLKYKEWPTREKRALKFVKGKVLDVGCGAGRTVLYLQKKGFDVIGIDNSPLAIKVCKMRGAKKAMVMSITDVGKFKPDTFNTITMMWNNFGLFGSPKRAKALLKKFYRITAKDAIIIAESNDVYKTKDPAHLSYLKFNRSRGRISGQIRFRVRFKKYVTDWFDYLMVSKKEMKEILEGTGWRIKKIINIKRESMYIAIIEKIPR